MRDSAQPKREATLREFSGAKRHRDDIPIYVQESYAATPASP